MLKKILLVVAALVVVLLVIVATRPADFRLERSVVIEETPRRIFRTVADFHQWARWSPWAELDPAMKTTFEGNPGQPGSSYAWSGNDKVGEGRMTVIQSTARRELRIKLEFLKPWKATNETIFRLQPDARGTRVTWMMQGQRDFVGKAMSLVMDMDKVVGPDFERGLAKLKEVVEKESDGE